MRQISIALFVLAIAGVAIAQDAAQQQLTPVPPKPSCNPNALFHTVACEDLWKTYNAAIAQRTRQELQLYVNKQKENAASEATAPLEQQIAGLTKLSTDQQDQIKSLQDQMKANSDAALQAKSEAHTQGLEQGAGIGAGGMLLLFGVVFVIKKLTGTRTAKPLARGASA